MTTTRKVKAVANPEAIGTFDFCGNGATAMLCVHRALENYFGAYTISTVNEIHSMGKPSWRSDCGCFSCEAKKQEGEKNVTADS